jgi:hypothetical protein
MRKNNDISSYHQLAATRKKQTGGVGVVGSNPIVPTNFFNDLVGSLCPAPGSLSGFSLGRFFCDFETDSMKGKAFP